MILYFCNKMLHVIFDKFNNIKTFLYIYEFCTEIHCLAKKKIKMSTALKIFSKLVYIAGVGNGGY